MGNVAYGIFQAFVFLIVFGSILFIAFVTTRYIGGRTNRAMKGKYIQVIESVSLGMDKQIYLIKAGEQFVLVAASGKTLEFLTTVKLDEYEDGAEALRSDNAFDFKSFFDKYLQSFRNKKEDTLHPENTNTKGHDLERRIGGEVFKSNLNKLRTITVGMRRQDRENGDENTNEK